MFYRVIGVNVLVVYWTLMGYEERRRLGDVSIRKRGNIDY